MGDAARPSPEGAWANVGDQLEAEFAGGRIVLRVGKASSSGQVSGDVPARESIDKPLKVHAVPLRRGHANVSIHERTAKCRWAVQGKAELLREHPGPAEGKRAGAALRRPAVNG